MTLLLIRENNLFFLSLTFTNVSSFDYLSEILSPNIITSGNKVSKELDKESGTETIRHRNSINIYPYFRRMVFYHY